MMGTGGYIGPSDPVVIKPEERADAAHLVMMGGRLGDIAERYNASKRTLLRWIIAECGADAAKDALSWENPDMLHEFPLWVRAECVKHGIGTAELAKRTGLTEQSIKNVLAGRVSCRLKNAVAIIDALGEL